MEARHTAFSEKLGTYLKYAEIGALIVSVFGLTLIYSNVSQGMEVLMIGMGALAGIYFLYGFTLPPLLVVPDAGPEASKKGFIDLLPSVLRKVAYIGCSVAVIGLLFEHLQRPGSEQLLMIGGVTLLISCLLSGIMILISNASIVWLRGPLLRGVPILVFVSYWFFMHGHH
jgi:hypothetical protein